MREKEVVGRCFSAFLTILLIAAFLFTAHPLAGAEKAELDRNMFLYKDAELTMVISNEVRVIPTSNEFYVDYVLANLTWFPRQDYRQKLISIKLSPEANISASIPFQWSQPAQGMTSFPLRLEARLITKNSFVEVQRKIPFPIKNLNREMRVYLEPGEIIDVTPEIQELARQLTEGKTDLYDVVFTLADWVNTNINYNLSTLTADASQKSSWVLQNRQGVCDEITSLFISLLRSLGIPAKFISGMSYTDLDIFESHWGPHGWAEVYFPDVGWVPFDVTYRELGFLDAGHIKLKESFDAKENSMEYFARGRSISIEGSQLHIDIDVLQKGPLVVPQVDVNVNVKYPSVGFGSYNLVEAQVRNMQDYYVSADLSLSRTDTLEVLEDRYKKSALLAPGERKKVHWIVRTSESLSANYLYTFPVEVRDIRGAKSRTTFTSSRNGLVYDFNDVNAELPKEEERGNLNVDMACTTAKDAYYVDENPLAACTLRNLDRKRNTYEVCLELVCQQLTLEKQEQGTISVELAGKPGMNNFAITAASGMLNPLSKTAYVLIDVLNKPELTIRNVTYPATIGFEEEGAIGFTVELNPESVAQNVSVRLIHKKLSKEWVFPDLEESKEFKILFYGNNLKASDNRFVIKVVYEDQYQKAYTAEQEFEIELKDLSLFQKVVMFIEDIETSVFGS